MKRTFTSLNRYLMPLVIGLILSASSSLMADTAGYHDNYAYYSWGHNRGVAMCNLSVADGYVTPINIHYKKDANGVARFYVDEACTVQFIGLGFDTNPWNAGISWVGVVDGQSYKRSHNVNTATDNSPSSIGMLLAWLHQAFTAGDGGNPWSYVSEQNLKIIIHMHDSYQIRDNEFGATHGSTVVTSLVWAGGGEVTFKRHADMIGKGTLFEVISTYDEATPGTTALNFSPGQNSAKIFDNATTSDSDSVFTLGTKALLMLIQDKITNSLSGPTKDDYRGIGVTISGNSDDMSMNGALELGTDDFRVNNYGSCNISKCHIAVETLKGVCRFKAAKSSDPYDVSDNYIAINLHPGTSIGKWAGSLDAVIGDNVKITLAEIEKWKGGDAIFTSGYYYKTQSSPAVKTDLTPGDFSKIVFADAETGLTAKAVYESSGSHYDGEVYPLFSLASVVIHNTRLNKWYVQLSAAVADTDIQAGDELVYFGNVLENSDVVIDKDLTIRAAQSGNAADEVLASQNQLPIRPSGYTAFKGANGGNFITVTNGATVTLGGSNSGPFTLEGQKKGRGVEVANGTLNVAENAIITHCVSDSQGGGIYASASTAHVILSSTDNRVYNNTAEDEGDDIYVSADATLAIGTVADGLLLEPCECCVIEGWFADAAGNRWVGHNTSGEYHLEEVTSTPAGSAYALKAAHGNPCVLVHWVNWDDSEIKSEYVKINTTPVYTGDTPFRPSDNQNSYEFTGWNPDPAGVTVTEADGEYTFKAQYTPIALEATVIFKNYDGSVLVSFNCPTGTTPAYPTDKPLPTRPSTFEKRYTFDHWTPEIVEVTDATQTYVYTAVFREVTLFTVTYRDANGGTFAQYTGLEANTDTPKPKTNPTREHYTFDDWKNWSATVTGDATYDPLWTPDKFVVEYVDTFGNTYQSDSYDYDSAMPTAPSVTHPTSVTSGSGDVADYDFASWTCNVDPVPSRVPAEKVTFTAQWDTFFHVHVGDIDNRIAVAQAEDGKFDVTLPVADVLAYPEKTIYAGLWTDSGKSAFKDDVCGKEMPVAVSTHVYVREIADCYAKSFVLSVGTKGTYASMLMAAIDVSASGEKADVPYTKVGFVFMDDANTTLVEDFDGQELYSKVNVTINEIADSYDSEDCGCPAGMMLFCRTLDPDWLQGQKGTPLTLHSYFVTPDGVRVYAASYKEITFKVTAKPARRTVDCAYTTEKEIDNASAPYGEEMLPMLQLETFSLGEPAVDDVVVTLHVDGLESTITGKAGDDFRALAGCPVLEGFYFAGWYEDQEFTIPADLSQVDVDTDVDACFVKADGLLEVNSSSTSARGRLVRVRLVSACRAEAVASCGFLVERDGKVSVVPEECFRSVDGATAESLFGIDDAMLFYCDLPVSALTGVDELKVTPFWMTLDGTRVCGKATTVELKK